MLNIKKYAILNLCVVASNRKSDKIVKIVFNEDDNKSNEEQKTKHNEEEWHRKRKKKYHKEDDDPSTLEPKIGTRGKKPKSVKQSRWAMALEAKKKTVRKILIVDDKQQSQTDCVREGKLKRRLLDDENSKDSTEASLKKICMPSPEDSDSETQEERIERKLRLAHEKKQFQRKKLIKTRSKAERGERQIYQPPVRQLGVFII